MPFTTVHELSASLVTALIELLTSSNFLLPSEMHLTIFMVNLMAFEEIFRVSVNFC